MFLFCEIASSGVIVILQVRDIVVIQKLTERFIVKVEKMLFNPRDTCQVAGDSGYLVGERNVERNAYFIPLLFIMRSFLMSYLFQNGGFATRENSER